ncbi:hypothetical protein BTO30_15905 [Domibacillus antri]|uniref:Methyl-accepting chemotaxis protein n=1 Tax=Domibacillus antri TaxID=1714264 RepID=A0A1Q8Q1P9_9BACI|nr:methyl-accepting chemotaxis protein [Domibacillus antri]OLN21266.1 hypothetical protein BTO30_15905 [Domibacillus antri]
MKLTVRNKLLGGFFIILVLLGIIGGIGNYQLANINERYKELMEERVTNLISAKDMKQEITNQTLYIREFLISEDQTYIKRYGESVRNFESMLQPLKASANTNEGKATIERIETLKAEYQKLINEALDLKNIGDENGYLNIMNSSAPGVTEELTKSLQDLEKLQMDNMVQSSEDATKHVAQVQLASLFIMIAAIVIGIGTALWISRQIAKPIQTLVFSMKQVASGDLRVQEVNIKSRDEMRDLGNAFNQMIRDLKPVISDVRESSAQVAVSSEQLNAGSQESRSASEGIARLIQQTAEGMEQQLHYFNDVQSSMQEMAKGMDQITLNNEEMLQSTETTNSMTKEGAASIHKVLQQMNKITDSASHTAEVIRSLGNRSNEIQNIVGFITEIAEQTNLLALNAAIEAARAGENGKGFAVVAEEVRKLAEESKKSAQQITQMIALIQSETHQAVTSIKQQNNDVEEGLLFTQEANGAFAEIEGSVGQVTHNVEEMSSSIQNLDTFIVRIVQAVDHVQKIAEASAAASQQVNAGTEENAATIEEVSANAQNLAILAETLQESVSRFKLD